MLNHSKHIKLFAVILSVFMIVSLFATPTVFGADAPICGDANGDGGVSIGDVTMIQQHLGGLLTLPDERLKASDVSGNGVDINDATLIQKWLAKFSVAYPIWHGQAPKIIYTFLESYDLSCKTIIPFCTSASSPLGTSASNLHKLAPGAVWKDGRRFAAGTSQATIEAWLKGMGY